MADPPTPCACGCGAAVSPGRTFVVGHHARVARRASGGRILPIFTKPPCACGCGVPVRSLRARYRQGHGPVGPGAGARKPPATAPIALLPPSAATGGNRVLAQLVARALARTGLTVAAAIDRLGIAEITWYGWVNGHHRPRPAHLSALVTLLDEPELLRLIEPYAPAGKLRISCPRCHQVRLLWPAKVRAILERSDRMDTRDRTSGGPRVTVDWQAGRGTAPCHRCVAGARMAARFAQIRKRHGRAGQQQISAGLVNGRRRRAAEHPIEEAAHLARLHEANRGRQRSTLETARQGLGTFSLTPRGRFGICSRCGLLTFSTPSEIAQQTAVDSTNPDKLHRRCWFAWRGSPEMRDWMSRLQRARRAGLPPPPRPAPPHASSRQSVHVELAAAYATTVRFYRLHTGSRRADRDDDGQLRSIAWLAGELKLTRQGLYKRVERFLALLPTDDRATGRLKRWRDVFLTIQDEFGRET